MPNFLCLQRSLATNNAKKPSPAEMQEMYSKFNEWRETFKDQLVDLGGRLGEGRLVATEAPSDGPLVEIKELAGGYMIVRADDLDGAISVAEKCPGLVRPGSGVEVIEIKVP